MANKLGRITINHKEIIEVDGEPQGGAGTAAPIGSMAMYDSGAAGSVWIKIGALNTDWSRIDVPEFQDWEVDGNALTGGTPTTPNEFMGSDNDYDVLFKRNSIEKIRLANAGVVLGDLTDNNGSTNSAKTQVVAQKNAQVFSMQDPSNDVNEPLRRYFILNDIETTDATETTIFTLPASESRRYLVKLRIVAQQHAGVAGTIGDGADYERTFSIKRLAAGNIILNDKQTDWTEEDNAQWNVILNANVSTQDLEVKVKAEADKTVRWHGILEIMAVEK